MRFAETLRGSGFSDEQAKGLSEAVLKAQEAGTVSLVTTEDMFRVESKLIERMTKIEGELTLIKWMMGIMLAGVISLVMKAFFMH
ncbi:hypothetical protein E2O03_008220 [Candidatus Magnetomonas plexicatena]|nr:hypothetical protein E2O03_008220 [Nitrospirales bacterium LBB_01]